jgi:hypothetical protein
MTRTKRIFLYNLFLLFISGFTTQAQKQFAEGMLTYKVTIEQSADQEGLVQYQGKYIITVKGKLLRKELVMDNGFRNIMLYTSNATYMLRNAGNKKLAIEMDRQEMDNINARYKDFSITNGKETKTIAGIEAQRAVITYKDGNHLDLFCTTNWQPGEAIFDKFPGITVMPMSYTLKNEDGTIMHFKLIKAEEKAIENKTFTVPEDYKIMTHKEYEQLAK